MLGCTLNAAQNSSGPQQPHPRRTCLSCSHSFSAGPYISRLGEARPEVDLATCACLLGSLRETEPPRLAPHSL